MLRTVTAHRADSSGNKGIWYGQPESALQHQMSLLAAEMCPGGIQAALKQGKVSALKQGTDSPLKQGTDSSWRHALFSKPELHRPWLGADVAC